jgi:hypothetical protein
MARLPTPGSDAGTWGDVLNEFLSVAHNSDGTIAASSLPDATDTTKGAVQLAGDLSGTAAEPTVPELANKQPLNSNLTTIGGVAASNDDVLQYKAGAWTNRTPVQLKFDLSLSKSDVGLSNVDNTSDLNKSISTATQTALNGKVSADSTETSDPAAPLLKHRRQFAVDSTNRNIMEFYAGTTPTLNGWINEWGGYRAMPYFNWDAAVRIVANPTQSGNVIEYQNNARDTTLWGIDEDGYVVMSSVKMAPVVVLNTGDPVPAGTPAGTVIIRT